MPAFEQARRTSFGDAAAAAAAAPPVDGVRPVKTRYDVKVRSRAHQLLRDANVTVELSPTVAAHTLAFPAYARGSNPNPACSSSKSTPSCELPVAQRTSTRPTVVRPSSATLRSSSNEAEETVRRSSSAQHSPSNEADETHAVLRRVQSASALRREQRRAATVEAALTAASRPSSTGCKGAAAGAATEASAVRAAVYEPSVVSSAVPDEYRMSSRLPIFTGHTRDAADRDHGYVIHQDVDQLLHHSLSETTPPRGALRSRPASAGPATMSSTSRSAATRPALTRPSSATAHLQSNRGPGRSCPPSMPPSMPSVDGPQLTVQQMMADRGLSPQEVSRLGGGGQEVSRPRVLSQSEEEATVSSSLAPTRTRASPSAAGQVADQPFPTHAMTSSTAGRSALVAHAVDEAEEDFESPATPRFVDLDPCPKVDAKEPTPSAHTSTPSVAPHQLPPPHHPPPSLHAASAHAASAHAALAHVASASCAARWEQLDFPTHSALPKRAQTEHLYSMLTQVGRTCTYTLYITST